MVVDAMLPLFPGLIILYSFEWYWNVFKFYDKTVIFEVVHVLYT